MKTAGRERGEKVRKPEASGAERQENAKKILNRGNEPKDLLKTQHLAFFEAKNEPKTNPTLGAKEADQSEKSGCRWRVSGDRWWGLGA
jgi:hypothetical protein